MVFVSKVSCNSYALVTVDSIVRCHLRAGCGVGVTRTKFFVVNGISILSLWNIELTFEIQA